MATNRPTTVTTNEFQLFDCVAAQIMNTFNLLKDQLIARRDALLNSLQIMRVFLEGNDSESFHCRAGCANTTNAGSKH